MQSKKAPESPGFAKFLKKLGKPDVDSAREAEQVYLAIDSRLAVKTGRNTFEEGLRKANLLGKLQSPVFLTASAVSALAAASAERDPLVAVPRMNYRPPNRLRS